MQADDLAWCGVGVRCRTGKQSVRSCRSWCASLRCDLIVARFTRSSFYTATFANDARIVAKATELHEQLVADLKGLIPDGDFTTQCLLQPLPQVYGETSARNGGNIMGVQKQRVDGLLFVAIVLLKTAAQQAFAYPRIRAWVEELKAYAATIENGNLDWVYLNYADGSQDPLRSYGAENVRKMKFAAAKYDPDEVFQKLCVGGFKISHVDLAIAQTGTAHHGLPKL